MTAHHTALGQFNARRKTVIRPQNFSGAAIIKNIKNLLQYRDLLYTLSLHRIKVRYKQSLLGAAWAILQPVSMMVIFTIIFSFIAKIPSDGVPYAVFAYSALLPWTCFSTGFSGASNGLVSHSHLITKVYFPREILPITYVIAALFDLLVSSTALIGLLVYFEVPVTANALYAIPIILVLVALMTAMSLFFSALQVRFRDIAFAVPLLLQIWMFATPVIYPLSVVPEQWRPLYILNPMVGIVENFRRVVVLGAGPDFYTLSLSAAASLLLLAASYVYFKRVETTMADII